MARTDVTNVPLKGQPIHDDPGRRPVVDRPWEDGAFCRTQTKLTPMFEILPPRRRRRRQGRLWDLVIRLGEAGELVQWAVVIAASGYLLGRLWPLLPVIVAHVRAGAR